MSTENTRFTSPSPLIGYEEENQIATITFNRPESLNSLTWEAKEALVATVEHVASDDNIRAVVLTGTGRGFCVGQDLQEHAQQQADGSEGPMITVARHYNPVVRALAGMGKPSIASINGVAAGAGASLALACDFRIMAASASITTAFAAIALSADTGASWTLQRIVSPAKARELLLMPRSIDSAEAAKIGLVTQVVPDEELAETTAKMARGLANGPTRAFAAIKTVLDYSASHTLEESLQKEDEAMAQAGDTSDHIQAVQSFLNKQTPRFTGS